MMKFNNRILTMTTMLLAFSFMTTAKAQNAIDGTTEGGTTPTPTCEMPPSCESLGYNKTAADCANKVTLKCPMDESKLYCADAKQNGVCSEGYSEIEKIIPYCTGDKARLIYDTKNPNCAKCQKCGAGSHLTKVSGCCPAVKYGTTVDGCPGATTYGDWQRYDIQDSNGCWTCSKCRQQYTLNADGLCVDPSVITGGVVQCPSGYAKYEDIIAYCSGPSETTQMVEHSSTKGCYQCKKCSTGYYFNNKCDSIGTSSDGNGCTRCSRCSIYSSDYYTGPVDGWCR